MCGRYQLHSHPASIALQFGLTHPPELAPRYNIAPSTEVPIVRVNAEGRRELVLVRWGLVPRWARDSTIGPKLINARGETITEKVSFRFAYRKHRCLLPADGFYEWMPIHGAPGEAVTKQPVHVGMKDGSLFAMGGLAERWRGPNGELLDTCTIVTTSSNTRLMPVHDRMPLIIGRDDYARWLDPRRDDAGDLIVPYPANEMAWYPISNRVNNVHHDNPALIECVAPAGTGAHGGSANEPHPHVPEQESLF